MIEGEILLSSILGRVAVPIGHSSRFLHPDDLAFSTLRLHVALRVWRG